MRRTLCIIIIGTLVGEALLGFVPLRTAAETQEERVAGPIVRSLNQATEGIQSLSGSRNACPGANEILPDCLELTDSFCSKLHGEGHRGNLDLGTGKNRYEIRLGNAPNGVPEPALGYARAKIAARNKLPADFARALDSEGYFTKLGAYLQSSQKRAKEMNLEEIIRNRKLGGAGSDLSGRLAEVWNNALDDVWVRRVSAKWPEYFRTPESDRPPAWVKSGARIWRELKASINSAIWRDHPRWLRTQKQYKEIQKEFESMILENRKLSQDSKDAWIRRIRETRLIIPGSDPRDQSLSTDACASTKVNAFYSPDTQTISICAGEFNSEEVLFTLGHELAHALDPGGMVLTQATESKLGKSLGGLARDLCKGDPPGCPSDWAGFVSRFPSEVSELAKIKLPDEIVPYLSCLKTKEPDEAPEDFLAQQSEEIATRVVGDLARSHELIDSALPELPVANGKFHPNPYYLKPYCEWAETRMDITEAQGALTIFAAQYACDKSERTREAKFADAIEATKVRVRQIARSALALGGIYSTRQDLRENGYAENVGEMFADTFGLRAVARILSRNPEYDSSEKRLNAYFANIAWVCDPPSNTSKFQEMAEVEKKFSLAEHPLAEDRQKRFLIPTIREALGCKMESKGLGTECDQI